jgi:hypothetical protein
MITNSATGTNLRAWPGDSAARLRALAASLQERRAT